MTYPKNGNAGPSLAELSDLARSCKLMRDRAETILDEIRPAIIGQQVIRYRRRYSVSHVRVSPWGDIHADGVAVTKRGKLGTRFFDLGNLEDCEFVPSLVWKEPKRIRKANRACAL